MLKKIALVLLILSPSIAYLYIVERGAPKATKTTPVAAMPATTQQPTK